MVNQAAPSYRRLGRTALQIGPLAIGTVNFSWNTNEQDSFAILDSAVDRGLNLVDTSDNYNAGATESLLGKYFGTASKRDLVVLATKCYSRPNEWGSTDPVKASGSWVGPNQRGLSAKHIIEACNASLRRLNTDYIDLYQMHHVDRTAPFEEIWQAYETLIAQGKVLYAGTSNYAGWQIAKACESAKTRHFLGPVSEQSTYSLLVRTVELEVIPACREYGLAFIPYSPVGGGLLAAAAGTEDGKRRKRKLDIATERQRQQLKDYAVVCAELGEHPADVAIAWVAANPNVTAPIIGPRTMQQLDGALHAIGIELSDDILKRLDEIFPGPGGEAPEAYAW